MVRHQPLPVALPVGSPRRRFIARPVHALPQRVSMFRDDLHDAVHPVDGRIRIRLRQHHGEQISHQNNVLDVRLVLEVIRQPAYSFPSACFYGTMVYG